MMVDSKAFLSKFERIIAEGQKAIERSKARQQDINRRAFEIKSESKRSQKRFEKKIAQHESESKKSQKRFEVRQDERDRQKKEIHELRVDLLKQKLSGSQAGLETAKTVPEPETKIDGEADSQQNVLIVHFSKTSKGWRIDYGSNKIMLDRHYAGVDCYRVLVTHSDRTMSALEVDALAGGTSDDQPARSRELLDGLSDLGDSSYDPKIDNKALREAEDRRDRLEERLESTTNPEESSSILEELEPIEKYLKSNTRQSKSGKVLKVLSNKAPLRKAAARVRRNIETFLEKIERYEKHLAIDLNRGLSLGDDCSFTPDPHRPIDFRFD